MRSLAILGITLAMFCSGCSTAFDLILVNNTSSEIGIVWQDKIVSVKAHCYHDLPSKPTVDSNSNAFSAIVIRDQQRYGYKLATKGLLTSKIRRSFRWNVQYYLILNEDGKVYLSDPKGKINIPLAEQPPGFPVGPSLVVSERSKPASRERMKTSHFEERIALRVVQTAQGRDESTQRELATYDNDLGGAWLVVTDLILIVLLPKLAS